MSGTEAALAHLTGGRRRSPHRRPPPRGGGREPRRGCPPRRRRDDEASLEHLRRAVVAFAEVDGDPTDPDPGSGCCRRPSRRTMICPPTTNSISGHSPTRHTGMYVPGSNATMSSRCPSPPRRPPGPSVRATRGTRRSPGPSPRWPRAPPRRCARLDPGRSRPLRGRLARRVAKEWTPGSDSAATSHVVPSYVATTSPTIVNGVARGPPAGGRPGVPLRRPDDLRTWRRGRAGRRRRVRAARLRRLSRS